MVVGWFAKQIGSKLNSGVIKLEEELVEREDTIKYSPTSTERMLFNPKDMSTMRPLVKLRLVPKMFRIMSPMISNMNLSLKSLSENPTDPKRRVDDDFTKKFEGYAYEIGVDDIAYTELSGDFIFKDKAVKYGGGVIVLLSSILLFIV